MCPPGSSQIFTTSIKSGIGSVIDTEAETPETVKVPIWTLLSSTV
jgi:hypothetical protein